MSRVPWPLLTTSGHAALWAMVAALVVRLLYAAWNVPDYWGDAYHNWYITQQTLEHGGVLTDYKGREVVWEPLYRYLAVFATALTGGTGLWPGRLVSLLASVATCGLVAALATRLCGDVRWGLAAGLTLVLTPWHVAYGWMYMPEATAGFAIMATLVVLHARTKDPWLVPLAALGVVVRHDVTVLLLLTIGWLVVHRRARTAGFLAGGLLLGLGLWSASTWVAAGDPLIWLTRRLSGSAANAAFAAADGFRPAPRPWTVPFMVVQAYAPIMVLLLAVAVGWRDTVWRGAARHASLLWMLLIAFVVLMAGMTLRFFSYPDPRYVLVLAPIGAILSMVAIRSAATRTRLLGWHVAVVVLSLVIQLPTFAVRAWTLSQHFAVGRYLGASPPTGRLVVDAPPAIYTSGLAAARFRSSGQLWEDAVDTAPPRVVALDRVHRLDVRWIYAFDAPSSGVLAIFPEMRDDTTFSAGGLRFSPVYQYHAFAADTVRAWWAPIRARIERQRGGGRVWHVTPEVP